jgi:hypothetical protein
MLNFPPVRRVLQTLAVASAVTLSSLFYLPIGPTAANASGVVIRPCEGSNLVGAFVSNQVGMGHVVTTVAITNVGTSTCALGGYPTLVGLRGTEEIKLRVTGHGTYGGNLRPTILAPRMSGALIISTGDLCGPSYGVPLAGHAYSGVIVVLPQNKGNVRVPGVTFDTTCGLAVSQLGWRNHFCLRSSRR